MSPVVYAAVWAACGVLAAVLLPLLRRRRLAFVAPALAGLLGLAVTVSDRWPGPTSAAGYGASLTLGHPAVGLLVAAGLSLAATFALAPRLEGGEVVAAAVTGAAVVVVLSATVPIIWSVAVAVAVATVAVRWIAAAPGRASLAAGRVAGLGAAALLAAAAFIPRAGPAIDTRTALAGGLLAGGISAILAIVPLGGWAAAGMSALRGADVAPWALLLAPALLFTVGLLLPAQPLGTRTPLANTLLGLGLVTAIYSALQALRDRRSAYGRVLIADLAFAAAALGTQHTTALLGGYLIVLAHLCAAPLLLNPARAGLERQRRMAWLSLVTVPPLPGFWGRFLCLQAFSAAGNRVSIPAYAAVVVLTAVAVRGLAGRGTSPHRETPPAGMAGRALGWVVVAALFGLGLAPEPIARHVFGVGF
ncbi:MAG TPA: hypothetical protein VN193_17490 [Candidatus Angelobacter sp.]|nr:hypothetical protein [Candidatus Angelobacter sp.]